ncbi:uncharacterized protein F4817DRAFT_330195 [Daldinia loculata]|uniref:uncharacterized protein n=1 Tax=Daldinia loculata TaxID=103429 RepID=UPI0020C299C7|nr:uncharacterized protein F4817DRAFT_330195 [Daldinia loculata]KAI1649810.1 hypothetical protein F4817DRAFT_330195 [Daldinia loculata]
MEQQAAVEILIHIGAPSRAADDVWYRSLASSYINFQPAASIDFLNQGCSTVDIDDGQGTQEAPIPAFTTGTQSSEPFGPYRSPQASFNSVIDNAGSPRVFARRILEDDPPSTNDETTMPITQSPWQTPSSEVQDSYVGNPIHISTFTSPTRILEHYLQRFDSPSSSQKTTSQRSGIDIPPSSSQRSIIPRSEDNPIPLLAPYTPSVIPCTPPCDPRSSLGGLVETKPTEAYHTRFTQDEVSSDNIVEETILIRSSDISSTTRADSEPPPAKRHQPDTLDKDPRALLRAASDIGPRVSSSQKSFLRVTFLSDHGYTYDSLELRAPEPPISVTQVDPQSFITPGLESLARDLDIPKRYRPKESKRDLRPSERGYWLVDCSAWDPQLKRDAWAYLANYVGTGVAGWGVSCRRDREFQSLRVYCWGLVTAHIYLLLYLASQRKILYTGSSWIDGEGIPVIVMQTRE